MYKVVWIARYPSGMSRQQFRNAVESDTWTVAVEDAQNVFDVTQMWGAALKVRPCCSGPRRRLARSQP
jgi:hypothetical protein